MVLALHGVEAELATAEAAIEYLNQYRDTGVRKPAVGYEIIVRYDNGDNVSGRFADKETAIEFLGRYRVPRLPVVNEPDDGS